MKQGLLKTVTLAHRAQELFHPEMLSFAETGLVPNQPDDPIEGRLGHDVAHARRHEGEPVATEGRTTGNFYGVVEANDRRLRDHIDIKLRFALEMHFSCLSLRALSHGGRRTTSQRNGL